jgi:hypothetical protein
MDLKPLIHVTNIKQISVKKTLKKLQNFLSYQNEQWANISVNNNEAQEFEALMSPTIISNLEIIIQSLKEQEHDLFARNGQDKHIELNAKEPFKPDLPVVEAAAELTVIDSKKKKRKRKEITELQS